MTSINCAKYKDHAILAKFWCSVYGTKVTAPLFSPGLVSTHSEMIALMWTAVITASPIYIPYLFVISQYIQLCPDVFPCFQVHNADSSVGYFYNTICHPRPWTPYVTWFTVPHKKHSTTYENNHFVSVFIKHPSHMPNSITDVNVNRSWGNEVDNLGVSSRAMHSYFFSGLRKRR